jgi:hypothetical protein
VTSARISLNKRELLRDRAMAAAAKILLHKGRWLNIAVTAARIPTKERKVHRWLAAARNPRNKRKRVRKSCVTCQVYELYLPSSNE